MMLLARRSRVLVATTLTLAASALAGCSNGDDGTTVAAAFYPLQYVSERVAGDHAEVVNLTRPGVEPHDLQLSPAQMAEVADADLVVFEGGFQAAVEKAVENNAEGESLDAAEVVDLLHAGESADEHREHSDEAEGNEDHADEDGHDHGEFDPHFWQDPLRLADLGDAVAEELAGIDPDNAADYRANAEALRSDLTALDREYADTLGDCARNTIVVNHDAFGYLTKYGLEIEPIAGLSPSSEPTAADLAELREHIEDDGITTVFSETLTSKKNAETLADSLDLATAVLDPLEGLTEDADGSDYLSVMRDNLAALAKANGC